jgi:hypothetical protein
MAKKSKGTFTQEQRYEFMTVLKHYPQVSVEYEHPFDADTHVIETLMTSAPKLLVNNKTVRKNKEYAMRAFQAIKAVGFDAESHFSAGKFQTFRCIHEEPEFQEFVINERPRLYPKLSESARMNKAFTIKVLEKEPDLFRDLPDALKGDWDVFKAVSSVKWYGNYYGEFAYSWASEEIRLFITNYIISKAPTYKDQVMQLHAEDKMHNIQNFGQAVVDACKYHDALVERQAIEESMQRIKSYQEPKKSIRL